MMSYSNRVFMFRAFEVKKWVVPKYKNINK